MTQAAILLISIFGLLLFAYLFSIVWLWLNQSKNTQKLQLDTNTYLIVYASQSGQVESFARQNYAQLQHAGTHVELITIEQLKLVDLQQASHVLWMVSTYGEGDAPDPAQSFQQNIMQKNVDLSHLNFAVLAFGDRRYDSFCHFGLELNSWLMKQNAKSYFDVVCVDQCAKSDLEQWSHHLSQVVGHELELNKLAKDWVDVSLLQCTHLNAGSIGEPIYHVKMSCENLQWQSGDILEIQAANTDWEIEKFLNEQGEDVKNIEHLQVLKFKNIRQIPVRLAQENFADWTARFDALATRDYSIASIPEQYTLGLVVRQHQTKQGLGLGSGWLTVGAKLAENVRVNVRQNLGFQLENTAKPMIFIGNGSGIAGLLSHLYSREKSGFDQNWLIFGERQKSVDYLFEQQLSAWKNVSFLQHLDVVFSRDQAEKKYVQHVILDQAEQLRKWIEQGAYIYVCGSLKGMAQGVDEALNEVLGHTTVERLRKQKRYRRDVY